MNINLLCDKILHIISDNKYYTAAVSVCKMLTVLCFEQKKIARSTFCNNSLTIFAPTHVEVYFPR